MAFFMPTWWHPTGGGWVSSEGWRLEEASGNIHASRGSWRAYHWGEPVKMLVMRKGRPHYRLRTWRKLQSAYTAVEILRKERR